MVYLKKILVPTDLSQFSLAAMEHAATFSLLYASKLHMLHVVDMETKEFHVRGEAEAAAALQEFVGKNVNPDMRLIQIVRRGNPAIEIRSFAEEEGVDLIVMATHGRTGVKHMVMGSVAEKVVRLSGHPGPYRQAPPLRESMLEDEDVENELHLR